MDDEKTQRALDAIGVALRAVIQFLQPFAQPEKWQSVPLYENAISYAAIPQFRRGPLGRVELRGGATTGTTTVFGVLPIGYRPSITQYMPVDIDGLGSTLTVKTTGELDIIVGGGAGSSVLMCGSFDTEA